jgi:5-deoxy-glucuronate isomerase
VSTGRDNDTWVRPAGSAKRNGWDVVIDDAVYGWQHTSLHAATLAEGERRSLGAGTWEHIVVPLHGSVILEAAGQVVELAGRPSVFGGPTDVAYVAAGSGLSVTARGGTARVALCGAQTGSSTPVAAPVRHVPAADVPVELRGAGSCSREVRNFGVPGVLDADSLIACEVLTPAGNWSSYPPHKHDEERPGLETQLEEIYYFEVQPTSTAAGPDADPVGYQRVYGSQGRAIDVVTEVRAGDVVLVPHGWHGPAMAAPGYDLYYLNVMAGPGPERAWLICDDPAHGWVRDTWASQDVDPRLPFGGAR